MYLNRIPQQICSQRHTVLESVTNMAIHKMSQKFET